MKKIALLGSTGSIGKQVLQVVSKHRDKFSIVSLAANTDYKELEKQMWAYKPIIASLSDAESANKVTAVPQETTFYYGENALIHAATCNEADVVFVAVMGFCGLSAVLAAIDAGKDVAIANKETLVAGGRIVTEAAKKRGVKIIPVDSEHSAIWQALEFGKRKDFEKLIITSSGGAFRDYPIESLPTVTAEQALKHPNWNMGAKITIDCATMVNKGFEVAEAMWLFNAPYEKIQVVIHRESIVHSMVEYSDGACIAQLACPDMKIPILLALSYPERLDAGAKKLDYFSLKLTFDKPDLTRYPCFKLVCQAVSQGKNYPCAISAANEVAVNLFLQGKIKFTEIYDYLSFVLDSVKETPDDLQGLIYTDKFARSAAIGRFNDKI